MAQLARILSGVLCALFTAGAIANLIAAFQGGRAGATGFGLAGLAAYYSFLGLRAQSDERAMRIARLTSTAFAVLTGLLALVVLTRGLDGGASMLWGWGLAIVSVCFALIAIGVRIHCEQVVAMRAAAEKTASDMRLVDLMGKVRFASGETLLDRMRGVPPPQPPVSTEPAAARPALYLSRTGLPVPLNHPARSYLGGLPKLPDTLAWPEKTIGDSTVAYLFIAQVDLEEVSACMRSELPEQGTVYFFMDGNDEAPDDTNVRVLYYEGRADALPMRAPPDTLQPYGFGEEPWPWLKPDEQVARIAFKYPVSFTQFLSHCDYEGAGCEEAHTLDDQELSAKIAPADDSIPSPRDALNEASPAWPFCWAVIEHACRALVHAIEDLHVYHLRGKPDSALQRFAELRARAIEWIDRAANHTPLTACDEESKTSFRAAWLHLTADLTKAAHHSGVHLRAAPDVLLFEAVHLACCCCASSEEDRARLIPVEYRKALENDALWRRSPVGYRSLRSMHQMLGFGWSVQSAPAQHANDTLLLQINGDLSTSWFPSSSCVLQFWIDPGALAARRFEDVRLTLECD